MKLKQTHIMRFVLGAGALSFVLFSAQPARGQSVSGEVLDCTGKVLRDVTVELYKVTTTGGTRTVSGGQSDQTDRGGYFRFPTSGGTLTGGTYYVVVKCTHKNKKRREGSGLRSLTFASSGVSGYIAARLIQNKRSLFAVGRRRTSGKRAARRTYEIDDFLDRYYALLGPLRHYVKAA